MKRGFNLGNAISLGNNVNPNAHHIHELLDQSSKPHRLLAIQFVTYHQQAQLQLSSQVDHGAYHLPQQHMPLGLTSLVLQRLGADITASDYHPLAGEFLLRNAALNQLEPVPYQSCDWAEDYQQLGLFDLVIGSDLLYERDHPSLLAGFIDRHCNRHAAVLIVDPGRGNSARFSRHMLEHGYLQLADSLNLLDNPDAPFKGRILSYRR